MYFFTVFRTVYLTLTTALVGFSYKMFGARVSIVPSQSENKVRLHPKATPPKNKSFDQVFKAQRYF